MTYERIDARGLLCPLPVIRLQDAAKRFPPGTRVELIGTDPGIFQDVPAWCRVHGHELLKTWQQGDQYHVLLALR
ncbi:sulfurtransferase TusA [Methylothermus subterraneus]